MHNKRIGRDDQLKIEAGLILPKQLSVYTDAVQWARTPPSASWRFDSGSGREARPPRRERSPRRSGRSQSPPRRGRGDYSPRKDDRRDRDYDRRDRDRSRSPDDRDRDMKDVRDRDDDRERERDRDRENGTNGDDRKGQHHTHLPITTIYQY